MLEIVIIIALLTWYGVENMYETDLYKNDSRRNNRRKNS